MYVAKHFPLHGGTISPMKLGCTVATCICTVEVCSAISEIPLLFHWCNMAAVWSSWIKELSNSLVG